MGVAHRPNMEKTLGWGEQGGEGLHTKKHPSAFFPILPLCLYLLLFSLIVSLPRLFIRVHHCPLFGPDTAVTSVTCIHTKSFILDVIYPQLVAQFCAIQSKLI